LIGDRAHGLLVDRRHDRDRDRREVGQGHDDPEAPARRTVRRQAGHAPAVPAHPRRGDGRYRRRRAGRVRRRLPRQIAGAFRQRSKAATFGRYISPVAPATVMSGGRDTQNTWNRGASSGNRSSRPAIRHPPLTSRGHRQNASDGHAPAGRRSHQAVGCVMKGKPAHAGLATTCGWRPRRWAWLRRARGRPTRRRGMLG